MCGISGLLKLNGSSVDRDQLGKMIATLHHRGPDASGEFVSGPVGLAHARLSIIDLQGGAQPMSTTDGRLWITFNGEIFNYIELREELLGKGHRFATRSDTEVILNSYREYGETAFNTSMDSGHSRSGMPMHENCFCRVIGSGFGRCSTLKRPIAFCLHRKSKRC